MDDRHSIFLTSSAPSIRSGIAPSKPRSSSVSIFPSTAASKRLSRGMRMKPLSSARSPTAPRSSSSMNPSPGSIPSSAISSSRSSAFSPAMA